jgi:regulator of cell morphogenesis and NO signaling
MTINTAKTVRELAIEVPGATRLFEKLGIDYCCGGHSALETACDSAGIQVNEVVRILEEANQSSEPALADWQHETLAGLASYIVSKHHVFTREEMDRLEPLLAKVASVYGQSNPELIGIAKLFQELKRELLPHMLKEEQILFPYIAQLESSVKKGTAKPFAFFGTVQNPVNMMMTEHETAGELLRGIRDLSSNFTVPPNACVSFQTLYQALQGFESDLHEHIHLENNLLFPRAVEIEASE